MNLKKVYIIIVNYNGWKDTIECLESLANLKYLHFQIIIIDNASQDDSVYQIQDWVRRNGVLDLIVSSSTSLNETQIATEKILLIRSMTNLGFAGGNNIGVQFATSRDDADFIWLLNNDTVVEEFSLEHFIDYLDSNSEKVGIVGSKVMEYYNRNIIQAAGGGKFIKILGHSYLLGGEKDEGQYDKPVKIDYVHGASMFIPVSFIKDVGLMSEEYFLYFEELDWSKRGLRRGWKTGYAHRSVIYHKGGASTTKGTTGSYLENSSTLFSDFYYQRSKILFTKKFYWFCLPTVYLSFLLTIANRIRRKQYNRIPMLLKLLFNPKSTSIKSALLHP